MQFLKISFFPLDIHLAMIQEEIDEKVHQAQLTLASSQRDSLTVMIAKDEDRLRILTRMMSKIYEDRMAELITEDNFKELRRKTQAEQKEFEERIRLRRNQLDGSSKEESEYQHWAGMKRSRPNRGPMPRRKTFALL